MGPKIKVCSIQIYRAEQYVTTYLVAVQDLNAFNVTHHGLDWGNSLTEVHTCKKVSGFREMNSSKKNTYSRATGNKAY